MSTFSLETLSLLRQREIYYAILNVAVSIAGCLTTTMIGYLSLRWLTVSK
jgi:fluoride ion exporter CrcB/FEX